MAPSETTETAKIDLKKINSAEALIITAYPILEKAGLLPFDPVDGETETLDTFLSNSAMCEKFKDAFHQAISQLVIHVGGHLEIEKAEKLLNDCVEKKRKHISIILDQPRSDESEIGF